MKSKNINKDNLTYILSRVIDVLLASNPQGTMMGVTFGSIIHFFFMLFLPFFDTFDYLNVEAFKIQYFIAIGIFIFNSKAFFSEDIEYEYELEKALNSIKKMECDGLISNEQAKIQYHNLIRNYVKKKVDDNEASSNQEVETV